MAVIGNSNIIKISFHETDGWYNRASNSWGEINSNYRLTVQPKRSDSKIIFEATLPSQRVTHHAMNFYSWYNISDSAFVNAPNVPSGQTRAAAHCPSRGQYNSDNAVVNVIRTITDSWGTSSKTFGLWCKTYANDTTRHNHSGGNTVHDVHWSSNMVMLAYEVEDI